MMLLAPAFVAGVKYSNVKKASVCDPLLFLGW